MHEGWMHEGWMHEEWMDAWMHEEWMDGWIITAVLKHDPLVTYHHHHALLLLLLVVVVSYWCNTTFCSIDVCEVVKRWIEHSLLIVLLSTLVMLIIDDNCFNDAIMIMMIMIKIDIA